MIPADALALGPERFRLAGRRDAIIARRLCTARSDAMAGPLEGINVVEFSTMIATPTAGMLLADMGANVIKVEPPWGDLWRYAQAVLPTDGRPFMAYNRGKRSMTLEPDDPGVRRRGAAPDRAGGRCAGQQPPRRGESAGH